MLINFLGAPCSGKTTTAARLYAELKDQGYPAEFVPEQARRFIAQTRLFKLVDSDQLQIMAAQYKEERLFADSKELVVCDSSLLNTLLYMSDEVRHFETVRQMVEWTDTAYSVTFLCEPVKPNLVQPDPHRIHTWEQSLEYHAILREILAKYAPWIAPVVLSGDTKSRAQEALRAVFAKVYHANF